MQEIYAHHERMHDHVARLESELISQQLQNQSKENDIRELRQILHELQANKGQVQMKDSHDQAVYAERLATRKLMDARSKLLQELSMISGRIEELRTEEAQLRADQDAARQTASALKGELISKNKEISELQDGIKKLKITAERMSTDYEASSHQLRQVVDSCFKSVCTASGRFRVVYNGVPSPGEDRYVLFCNTHVDVLTQDRKNVEYSLSFQNHMVDSISGDNQQEYRLINASNGTEYHIQLPDDPITINVWRTAFQLVLIDKSSTSSDKQVDSPKKPINLGSPSRPALRKH